MCWGCNIKTTGYNFLTSLYKWWKHNKSCKWFSKNRNFSVEYRYIYIMWILQLLKPQINNSIEISNKSYLLSVIKEIKYHKFKMLLKLLIKSNLTRIRGKMFIINYMTYEFNSNFSLSQDLKVKTKIDNF